jgi:hypothetical protein
MAATRLADAGCDAFTTAAILGHSFIQMSPAASTQKNHDWNLLAQFRARMRRAEEYAVI